VAGRGCSSTATAPRGAQPRRRYRLHRLHDDRNQSEILAPHLKDTRKVRAESRIVSQGVRILSADALVFGAGSHVLAHVAAVGLGSFEFIATTPASVADDLLDDQKVALSLLS
jgi:hypothetical protein